MMAVKRMSVVLLLMMVVAACTQQNEPDPNPGPSAVAPPQEGELTIQAPAAANGTDAKAIMDGDPATGWISERPLDVGNMQEIKIDLGKAREVTTLTIDDAFPEGYTNEKDNDELVNVLVSDFDTSSWSGNASPEKVFTGQSERNGWVSEAIPSAAEPQFMEVIFAEEATISRIDLENSGYGTVPVRFTVDYSVDGETFVPLWEVDNNTELTLSKTLEQEVTLKALKYTVYDQSGEPATLDGMKLYATNPQKKHPHYPRKYSVLGSINDVDYEVLASEDFNDQPIRTYTFEPRSVRFIKYVVMEELEGNRPSLGEIILE